MASFQLCFLTLIFPPQRGEHNPLMWGFIPHVRGDISRWVNFTKNVVDIYSLSIFKSGASCLYLCLGHYARIQAGASCQGMGHQDYSHSIVAGGFEEMS